jgi:hypothetical protein
MESRQHAQNRGSDFSSGLIVEAESRLLQLVALSSCLMGCRSVGAPTTAPERCGPAVPASAEHPITARAIGLAGDYELIQVQTQPRAGETSVGRLHLAPLDSAERAHAVGGAVRDLVGWLETEQGDTAWRPNAGSKDPAHPGAVLAGDHLRLGEGGGPDSHAEHLMITAVGKEGFWGWWKAQPGWEVTLDEGTKHILPDPAGYFCASRVRP